MQLVLIQLLVSFLFLYQSWNKVTLNTPNNQINLIRLSYDRLCIVGIVQSDF